MRKLNRVPAKENANLRAALEQAAPVTLSDDVMREEIERLRATVTRYEAQMLRMSQCAGEFAKDAQRASSGEAEPVLYIRPQDLTDKGNRSPVVTREGPPSDDGYSVGLYTAPPAQPGSERDAASELVAIAGSVPFDTFLTERDAHALHRFIECCEDCDADGHDCGKEAIKRLTEIGVVRDCGFGRHELTAFGSWVHDGAWSQIVQLPLVTHADVMAARSITAQQGEKGSLT